MKKKLAAAAIAAGTIISVGAAGTASAHPMNPKGNDKTINIGGPLVPGDLGPGNGAQGHYKGIDCNAGPNPKTPIVDLGIFCNK